jgi:hypothetical protein
VLFLSTFSMGLAVSAKKECSSQVFLHFSSDFAYIGPIREIRVKVDQNSPIGLPAEKKVTEGGPRVSIIVQVLGNQGTARSTHRIWAAEGRSNALVWVSAWMAQTGVAVRLLIKRERHVERHVLASGRTPLFFCLGGQTVAKKTLF